MVQIAPSSIMNWSISEDRNWTYKALVIVFGGYLNKIRWTEVLAHIDGSFVFFGWLLSPATICGFCNYYHVSTLFENDRHFSHLSTLEREMTFRTEMGLYYSYYKRIVQAPSFLAGLNNIMNDNLTEYPSTINTLQRFNVYPEVGSIVNSHLQLIYTLIIPIYQVALGAAFRGYTTLADLMGMKTKDCWQVHRGGNLPAVESCEGLGDPSFFYVHCVWLCAGLTAAIVFIYGLFLSESFLGGVIAIVSFFFNHSEVKFQICPHGTDFHANIFL